MLQRLCVVYTTASSLMKIIPKNELLCALQQSLCLLGSANHITTTLRRKKILAAINPDKVQLAEQEFPKAGKLLFGEDLPNLAAKHSELTKSLSKNLQKPYGKTQPYASGNFSRFPSQGNLKYNSQHFRSKSINKPFNSRPNNLEYSSRLSPAISHTTFTNSQTRDVSLKRKYSHIKRRNIKTSVKRGHSPCQFYQRSFLQPPLSCTQEGWRPAPSDRFKRSKSIRHQRTFSDGEHFMPQTNSESKRFYGKAGPQGRLPYSRRSRAISTLPTIHMAGPSVSISSPTVRLVHSPKSVYQTSKTCHNIPSDTQYSSPHIFGRYSNSGFRYKNIKRTNRSGFRSFAKPGFHNKLRKICTDSFSCHGISRTSSRLQNYDVLSTVTQGDKNNRTMQVSTSKQNCLAARACPVTGLSRIDTASCMAGSAAFQTSSILSDTTARSKQGFLRRPTPKGSNKTYDSSWRKWNS